MMEWHKRVKRLGPVETALGVSFHDKELLRLALVHSSYLNENPTAFSEPNERLEFLGDALIGAVVAEELYRRNPEWSEGRLTEARSALVRGETLARLAESLGLGDHLYMGRGEEAGGGRDRPTNLAAALEAVVGHCSSTRVMRPPATGFSGYPRRSYLPSEKRAYQQIPSQPFRSLPRVKGWIHPAIASSKRREKTTLASSPQR